MTNSHSLIITWGTWDVPWFFTNCTCRDRSESLAFSIWPSQLLVPHLVFLCSVRSSALSGDLDLEKRLFRVAFSLEDCLCDALFSEERFRDALSYDASFSWERLRDALFLDVSFSEQCVRDVRSWLASVFDSLSLQDRLRGTPFLCLIDPDSDCYERKEIKSVMKQRNL